MRITDGKFRHALVLSFLVSLTLTTSALASPREHILHRFNGENRNGDGSEPQSALISDTAGNLYGTTIYGGDVNACPGSTQYVNAGCGVVFEMSPPATQGAGWTETVLYEFKGYNHNDGSGPSGSLVFDAAGNLYGTTITGGSTSEGIVFELSPPTQVGGSWKEFVIHNFAFPYVDALGTLVFDAAGNLYGTIEGDGTCGSVYELSNTGGGWVANTIYSFTGSDGCQPTSGVIVDNAGHLFGTVTNTNFSQGLLYKLSKAQNGLWSETTVHTFVGGDDGDGPTGSLLISHGALFGTTTNGGDSACDGQGCGTVYRLMPGSGYSIIHRFRQDSNDGFRPEAGVISDPAGNLYGTTAYGGGSINCGLGPLGCGTVYELEPPSAGTGPWTEVTWYAFTAFNGDGSQPQESLFREKNGALFGTTSYGGSGLCSVNQNIGCGTVFAITP